MPPELHAVAGGGGLPLSRPGAVPHLRPGERPLAIELSLSSRQIGSLRRRARAQRLGVDAWAACLVEHRLVMGLLCDDERGRLAVAARARLAVTSLTATELRAWQSVVDGLAPAPRDDLPTLHLPLRLLTPLPPGRRAQWLLETLLLSAEEAGEQALLLERAATRDGLTMQAWALAQIVSPY